MIFRPLQKRLLAALGILLAAATYAATPIVLSEFMADNQRALMNGSRYPDWVELHNPSLLGVSLNGLSLSDDPAQPQKYLLPNTTLAAGAYLIIWCDANFTDPGLHTGFGLKSTGQQILFYESVNSTPVLRQSVVFGLQVPDLSLSRFVSGNTESWRLSRATAGAANQQQALGDPTQLRINEWMAAPRSGGDWVELHNRLTLPVAIGRAVWSDDTTQSPLPDLSFLGAGSYYQFFADGAVIEGTDHLGFKLSSVSEVISFRLADGQVVDEVSFQNQVVGISMGRIPDAGSRIATFPDTETPAASNYRFFDSVVINELLSHTDPPLEDAVELRNLSGSDIDVSGWYLSDELAVPKKYRIPNGTILRANGFLSFYEGNFNPQPDVPPSFTFNSFEGEEVVLSSADAAGNLLGERARAKFPAAENGVSFGRVVRSDLKVEFVPLNSHSFGVSNPSTVQQFRQGGGAANDLPKFGPVILNEICFQPVSGTGTNLVENSDFEYIELFNPGNSEVKLSHPQFPDLPWKLTTAVTWLAPDGLRIPARGYLLVVSFDPASDAAELAAFRSRYNLSSSIPIVGPFSGKLANEGETLLLVKPDAPQGPGANQGFVPYIGVDQVDYKPTQPWAYAGAGSGNSLQRVLPPESSSRFGNDPARWISETPTPGTANHLDTDLDRMPDRFETLHSLNITNPSDASTDSDRDGASNLAEYFAGTSPRSASSRLFISPLRKTSEVVTFSFVAPPGRPIAIFRRGDFSQASEWNLILRIPPSTESRTLTFEEIVPVDTRDRFYGVTVP